MSHRWGDDPRKANPPAQLAEYDARKSEQAQEHVRHEGQVDPEWSNAEVLDMILHPGEWCDVPGDHADPSRFDREDLLDMWRHDVYLCPLHLHPEYPKVPGGVWQRELVDAWERLRTLTVEHAGKTSDALALDADLVPPDQEVCGHIFHATPDELREVWEAAPHARWYLEQQAEGGFLDIRVVEV